MAIIKFRRDKRELTYHDSEIGGSRGRHRNAYGEDGHTDRHDGGTPHQHDSSSDPIEEKYRGQGAQPECQGIEPGEKGRLVRIEFEVDRVQDAHIIDRKGDAGEYLKELDHDAYRQ